MITTPITLSPQALSQAVEQSPVSIVITDLTGTIEYVNPWFTKVTGYTREEVLGQNPRLLNSGYMTPEEYAAMFRHLESGQVWRGEFRNRRKSGEYYWEEVVMVPVCDELGRPTHYMALKEDVTARKQAEFAREAMIGLLDLCNRATSKEDFLRQVTDYLRGVSLAETVQLRLGPGPWREGVTLFASGARLEGLGGENLKGIEILRGPRMLGRMDLVPASGRVFSEQEIGLWREMAEPLAVALAKFESEEALRLSEQRYRDVQKMEAVGQLAGGVAHDYNNILTATLLHLALLRETPGLSSRVLNTLDELEAEARRAAKLTRQLLLFSRRQMGKVERVDLLVIVKSLHSMLHRVLGEDVVLDFPSVSKGAWVDADAGMIEQLIMNLCVNARDAMEPRGGRLTVRIDAVQVGLADLAHRPKARTGSFFCIRVADTGCGMDEGTRERIFEPFFTTKGEGKGTGLGLATVYGIVERHQGWIEVDSELGVGSEFRVFLPAQGAGEAGRQAGVILPHPKAKGERILLVEDDPVVRATAASVLRMQGYQVFDVADGEKAFRVWSDRGLAIDLLLTDLVLPGGISGRDIVLQLRESKPNLPVIIMSGYGNSRVGLEIGDLQGVVIIAKPFELAQLAQVVGNCLAEKEGNA